MCRVTDCFPGSGSQPSIRGTVRKNPSHSAGRPCPRLTVAFGREVGRRTVSSPAFVSLLALRCHLQEITARPRLEARPCLSPAVSELGSHTETSDLLEVTVGCQGSHLGPWHGTLPPSQRRLWRRLPSPWPRPLWKGSCPHTGTSRGLLSACSAGPGSASTTVGLPWLGSIFYFRAGESDHFVFFQNCFGCSGFLDSLCERTILDELFYF